MGGEGHFWMFTEAVAREIISIEEMDPTVHLKTQVLFEIIETLKLLLMSRTISKFINNFK